MQAVDGTAGLQLLQAVHHQLHAAAQQGSAAERRSAEAALLAFQQSDAAWQACLQLLHEPAAAEQLLFAAQTLRVKVNAQGTSLAQQHKQQLLVEMLAHVGRPLPTPVLRQLCLVVASLAALLPCQDGWLQAVLLQPQLPPAHAVELLQLLAEEGASDWRHVMVPGLPSSGKLSWATNTRERFRSWATDALSFVLSALHRLQQALQQQQQQQDTALTVRLLDALAAWVKLGLRSVAPALAEHTAHAGLLFVQSASPQVVAAAQGLLEEVPEYATEQLLATLQPRMLAVAAAAEQAARSSPPALLHAAAWSAVFAAYAAALPQQLLAADADADAGAGAALRQALLRLSGLHHVRAGQPVCLPALHVWSSVLAPDADAGAGAGLYSRQRSSRAPSSDSAAPGSVHGPAAHAESDDESAAAVECEQQQLPQDAVQACQLLVLVAAVNLLHWQGSSEGRAACEDAAGGAVADVFAAASCVLGPERYMHSVMHVWGGQQQQQQQQHMGLPPQLQEQLQQAETALAAAPGHLRLQAALTMLGCFAAPGAAAAARGASDASLVRVAGGVASLLSAAAAAAPGTTGDTQAHARLMLHLCTAAQVWSWWLAAYLVSSAAPEGSASLQQLLQLLLSVVQQEQQAVHAQQPDAGRSSAAAAGAVRTLAAAAAACGWSGLPSNVPGVLQALRTQPNQASGADLLASLSLCLAGPGATQQQQQELGAVATQQLVQPAVSFFQGLLQQLTHSGSAWAAAAPAAECACCDHLARVRAVVDAMLLQQRQSHAVGSAQRGALSTRGTGSYEGTAAAAAADHLALCRVGSGQQHAPPDSASLLLVKQQLLPALHALVVRHGGSGAMLQQLCKVCTKLLAVEPQLVQEQPQLQLLLHVAVVGVVRPGGACLAGVWRLLLEGCCCPKTQSLLAGAPSIVQAFVQLWSQPEASGLQRASAGDAWPDCAHAVLKMSAAFMAHVSILQPSAAQLAVLDTVVSAAASCASCHHKRVSSTALSLLLAVLVAATDTNQPPQLLNVVAAQGTLVAQGALSALLVPAALPRLQRVSSVLLELASVAAAAAAAGSAGGQPPQALLHAWLSAAAASAHARRPPLAQQAAGLVSALTELLLPAGRPASGDGSAAARRHASLLAARKLKRRLRDFAEHFSRL